MSQMILENVLQMMRIKSDLLPSNIPCELISLMIWWVFLTDWITVGTRIDWILLPSWIKCTKGQPSHTKRVRWGLLNRSLRMADNIQWMPTARYRFYVLLVLDVGSFSHTPLLPYLPCLALLLSLILSQYPMSKRAHVDENLSLGHSCFRQ